jgi:hypothetical protein
VVISALQTFILQRFPSKSSQAHPLVQHWQMAKLSASSSASGFDYLPPQQQISSNCVCAGKWLSPSSLVEVLIMKSAFEDRSPYSSLSCFLRNHRKLTLWCNTGKWPSCLHLLLWLRLFASQQLFSSNRVCAGKWLSPSSLVEAFLMKSSANPLLKTRSLYPPF